jgi:pyruvate kinase
LRSTKIVVTLGPASESADIIRALIRAGMDVARINFSHGEHAEHARRIERVRTLAAREDRVVAIMADLQGPKLRIGDIAGGEVELHVDERFTLTTRQVAGDGRAVHFPYPEVIECLKPGATVLLDDGVLELRVIETTDTDAVCQVLAGGVLLPRKGVSIPHTGIDFPAITEKDEVDLAFALEQDVDYIALSFVRQASDVQELRRLVHAAGRETPIIAKIEKPEAVEHIEAILEDADAVMIARGDLGVEMPPEQVPLHQKRIIRLARQAARPVITATQMLESMIENPRPTRAEASDVANAILDGTDAIMLSGETAIGSYPVDSLKMMARIARATEPALPYGEHVAHSGRLPAACPTDAITQAVNEIAYELDARVIVPSTMSGYTARMVSRHRPRTPILVVTPFEQVRRQLALVWGVQTVLAGEYDTTDEMIVQAENAALKTGLAQQGDFIIITAGIPASGRGKTNMLKVHVVGAE